MPDAFDLASAHVLTREQILPVDRPTVFEYFSNPKNLEALTPPWLNFKIVTIPETLFEGAIIKYKLRLHGVPISWTTLINEWNPGESFVDTQTSGPFKLWHHEHAFEDCDGGTLVRDTVHYKIPYGPLGEIARRLFVESDNRKIFDYRRDAIRRELNVVA